jgi:CPA2 family monovalent cation:H+ antiporter-2
LELQAVIHSGENKLTATSAPWLQSHADWDLHIVDCVLPDLADVQGRQIAELELRSKFGCSVVGIERQGFMIPLPPPTAVLYPRDRVLLMGTTEQVRAGKEFLARVTGAMDDESIFEDVQMQSLKVPPWSRAVGRTLGDLALARTFGVQVAGVHRGGLRILNPGADETLCEGDDVLTLGTPGQIREFKAWVNERPEETSADESVK